jgi:hypothetical protein
MALQDEIKLESYGDLPAYLQLRKVVFSNVEESNLKRRVKTRTTFE